MGLLMKIPLEFTGYPIPNITWYREGFELESSKEFQITNTDTSSTLLIPDLLPDDAGMYMVKAYNPLGMAQTKAKLSVMEDVAEKEGEPRFTRSLPHDFVALTNEPAALECEVVGNPIPEITWFKVCM